MLKGKNGGSNETYNKKFLALAASKTAELIAGGMREEDAKAEVQNKWVSTYSNGRADTPLYASPEALAELIAQGALKEIPSTSAENIEISEPRAHTKSGAILN
jgi:hypothetical protein